MCSQHLGLSLNRALQLCHVVVQARESLLHLGCLLLFGAHKTSVGRDGIPHAVERVVEFFVELLVHGVVESGAQFLHFVVEVAFRAVAPRWENVQSQANQRDARDDASDV